MSISRSGDPGPGRSSADKDAATDQTRERLRDEAREVADAARQEARARLEEGRRAAAAQADRTTESLDAVSDTLAREGHDSLAQATSAIASQLASLADYVESHTVDELAREAQRLARRNPALLIAGGLVVGFALTRFLKASPPESETESVSGQQPAHTDGRAGPARGSGSAPGAVHAPQI